MTKSKASSRATQAKAFEVYTEDQLKTYKKYPMLYEERKYQRTSVRHVVRIPCVRATNFVIDTAEHTFHRPPD